MQKISIKSKPQNTNFYVGEVRVVNFPKRNFGLNWWAGDSFVDFCNETILRAFENLLINQVLICQTEVSTESYLFIFKLTEMKVSFSMANLPLEKCGLIEETICKIVSVNGGIAAEQLIAMLVRDLLGSTKKQTNPWRMILKKIVEANRLGEWSTIHKISWIGETIQVTFEPSKEQYLNGLGNAIDEYCAEERISNSEFALLCRRLTTIINRQIKINQDPPDGGS